MSLYAKIQQPYADDNDGVMCTILSYVTYIGCQLFKPEPDFSNFFKKLQFYVWLLTFYSIQLKYKQNIKKLTDSLESNISIIFPYLSYGLHEFIENINNKKISMGLMSLQEDICVIEQLKINKDKLEKNIKELNDILNDFFSSKYELIKECQLQGKPLF